MLTELAHPLQEPLTTSSPVRRLVGRSPVFVQAELTLRQVAEVLDGETIGVVLVRSQGSLSGLVSERDLVRALAEGADPDVDRADGVMADQLLTVGPEEPIGSVAERMLLDEVRHVPVVEGGTAVGMASLRDVLRVLLDERAHREGAAATG